MLPEDEPAELFPSDDSGDNEKRKARRPNKKVEERMSALRRKNRDVKTLDIEDVITHWMETMGKTKRPTLSEKTRLLIGAAIADYGIDFCKDAISGCSYSDFHMGRNKQKVIYNSLGLIFRNGENVERFNGYAS